MNGKFYIGSSVDILPRWYLHKYKLQKGNHDNQYLQASWNKYGAENFIFEIVEYVDDVNQLILREQYFIDILTPVYNVCRVAGNVLGRKHSEETKRKMSISISRAKKGKPSHRKGSKYTPEQYARVVEANRRPWSEDRKLKHKQSLTGRTLTDSQIQHLKKMGEQRRGVKKSLWKQQYKQLV